MNFLKTSGAAAIALCLAAAPARADDWAVMLGAVEIRESPGFSKTILQISPELGIYKVSATAKAKGEGSSEWYEIVLKEDRQFRKQKVRGWVLQLKGEPDPLSRPEVVVYKTPDTERALGSRKALGLTATGIQSPDGRWKEVTFEDRAENVRTQLGYVPASLSLFLKDPDLVAFVPRLENIRQQKWPLDWKIECVKGRIQKGFSRPAVKLALGSPTEVTTGGNGTEVWIYRRAGGENQVFFKGGKVTGWKKAGGKRK